MINNFAPIAIHTLNRHVHFKRCVESLSRCKYADQTELHIALDYPVKESHWEGYTLILDYISSIKGFKSVVLYKRDKNLGARGNSMQLKYDVLNKHDIIFNTEDDNEFSPNTLEYINEALELYTNDESILGVCTSHHQIEIPKEATGSYFIMDSYSPMGFATWKDKYLKYLKIDKKTFIVSFLKNYNNYKRFRKERLYIIASLLESISNNYILGDGVMTAYLLINKMQCVFPIVQKAKSHGYDGSGVNCADVHNSHPLRKRVIDNNFNFDLIKENNDKIIMEIRNNLFLNFKMPFLKLIFVKIRFFLFCFFNFTFSSLMFKRIYRKYFVKK
jgi:hypothetical protein